MKLTIALEKVGRFTIDLPEAQANDKFKSIVVGLLDTSTKCIKEENQHGQKNKEIINEKVAEQSIELPGTSDKKTAIRRNLVIMKCEECGSIMTPLIDFDEGNKTVSCRHCQHELDVNPANLYKARYECASCGQTATFLTDGSTEEVICKRCSSPIDLIFHEKKEMYFSPNLIK